MRGYYKVFVLIAAVLVFSTISHAQRISYSDSWGTHGFSLLETDESSVRLNYSLTEFHLEDMDMDGVPLKSVKVPGIFLPNNQGAPDLAGTGQYVAIPQGAKVSYSIIASRTEKISNIDIAPAPRIPLDTEDGPLHYKKDMNIYSMNSFYPAENVILKNSKIRGVDVVMIGITPFQYNPVTKELIIYRDLQIELKISGGGMVGDSRLRSRWWDPIIHNAVLNPNVIPEINYSSIPKSSKSPDYEYLIVVPDDADFISWADSIKNWRTLQGIRTGVVTTTEIGGNTVAAIETYVDNAYYNWDVPPSAVLLLGDYGTGTSGIISEFYVHPAGYPDFVSDNKFADVDNDELPDIAFARITANDASQLEVMITKFLDYERNPPTSADFYDHPITALGWQTERWFQICSEVVGGYFKNVQGKNPVRINAIYSGTPGTEWSTATNTATVVDYFGPSGLEYIPATPAELGNWSGGTATDVVNAINSGSFMLQHRDHGFYGGWGEPDFTTTNIGSLTNINNQLPYIFSINCQTGAFHNTSETFTEAFHRYTYGGQNSGALGVMAATEVSYSFVNDTYLWGVMDNMFPDFMPAETTTFPVNSVLPAFGNAAGKHFLYQSSWPYNTSDKLITYRLFHHHGDAFMTVYTEVPQALTVVHNAVLLSGTGSFNVTADAGSLIALTVNGEIIGTATGTGSPVSITIPPQNPGYNLLVTVTKQNYFRYTSEVAIIPPSGPYVAYSSHITNDAGGNNNGQVDFGENISIHMSLENVGSEPANNVNATLVCSDPYLTITDNYEEYGTINDGAIISIDNAFAFTIADDVPDQHIFNFEVQVNGEAKDLWTSYFTITANAPLLEFGDLTIDDNLGGNGNGRLDPGETADIVIPILNNGNSNSPIASALLTTASGYVTINSGSSSLGMINSGGSGNAVFNITCDPLTPVGTAADLHVDVSAINYGITNTFYSSIGLVLEDWETGNFGSYPWTFAGNTDWLITDVDPYEETWCAQSGIITHSQTSELEVELYVTIADNISFYRKVSSESGYDYLSFYIDGTLQEQWAGEVTWSQVSYPVAAGSHIFRWVYSKDGSVSAGSDCGWIDFIIFPPISPPPDPANIEISAENFEVTLSPENQAVQTLSILNTGEVDLDFTIVKNYPSGKSSKAYCASAGGGDDEFIQNVAIGTINNTTIQTDYGDYTSMSTIVNVGESYPITITNGDPNWSSDQCGIWVDWNQNEDFLDDEPVVVTGTPGIGPYTATIAPPVDALPGMARMRVQIIYSATPDPCLATFSYGEVEDYSLNVNSDFVDWFSLDPVTGSVIGSGSSEIELTFNSNNLDEGEYFVDVLINSNDPDEAQLVIPCTLYVSSGINVNLTALLEGPFGTTEMNTSLNDLGYLPNSQPYDVVPWNYSGTETVANIPNNDVVDWILVELRETTGDASSATPATIIGQKAGFILRNGVIVDLDGSSQLRFDVSITENIYVIVYHRNHLGVMSAYPLTMIGDAYSYNFTGNATQVYGDLLGCVEIAPGLWGLASGDADANGEVDNKDKNEIWKTQMGSAGYYFGDFDMNGQVELNDRIAKWKSNAGKCSFIIK